VKWREVEKGRMDMQYGEDSMDSCKSFGLCFSAGLSYIQGTKLHYARPCTLMRLSLRQFICITRNAEKYSVYFLFDSTEEHF
jgi:hypothetical protein